VSIASKLSRGDFGANVLYCDHESDWTRDGQPERTLSVRVLVALLVLTAASPAKSQMILPEVPHYDLQAGPQIDAKRNYAQPHDSSKTKGPDENNKGQNPESFGERLSAIFDKTLDDPVAFFNLCLSIATAILAFSTVRLWIVTAHNVRILEAIERPYFVLETLSGFEYRREQIHRVYVNYIFANIGRTPALVDELKADFVYSDAPPVPPKVHVFSSSAALLHDRPFPSNERFVGELPILIGRLDFTYSPVLTPNMEAGKSIYLIVLARYRDLAGRVHETGICRIRSAEGGRFVKYGGNKYNYMT
jgi:hypothetical protein